MNAVNNDVLLENLIAAIDEMDFTALDALRPSLVEVLGYDPQDRVQTYLVSLEIGMEARNAEEAVRAYIDLIESEGLGSWVYKTVDEKDNEEIIDTYYWTLGN